jgi:group I intron endonuclease
MEKTTGIYIIRNLTNGNCYVGSSVDINKRWGRHRKSLHKGNHHSIYLQRAWNTHGEDSFNFYVAEECECGELISREQWYIDALNPAYNISKTAGSPLGVKHTDETRMKMSISATGKFVSLETRKRMSIAQKNKSKETIEKHSAGSKGNQNWLGRKHTPETIAKMSATKRGKKLSQEHKNKLSQSHKLYWANKKDEN